MKIVASGSDQSSPPIFISVELARGPERDLRGTLDKDDQLRQSPCVIRGNSQPVIREAWNIAERRPRASYIERRRTLEDDLSGRVLLRTKDALLVHFFAVVPLVLQVTPSASTTRFPRCKLLGVATLPHLELEPQVSPSEGFGKHCHDSRVDVEICETW